MKKELFYIVALVAALGTSARANAQEVFAGDTRLACEAVLCLSSGVRPGECNSSLSRYFGIVKSTLTKTITARLNFLKLCPVSSQTPHMQSLVIALSQGAGRCDASSLNTIMVRPSNVGKRIINNSLPPYCAAYLHHAYTDTSNLPRYVGTPERGGYWVEAPDYDRALANYNERIRREDELIPPWYRR